jgi:hypothetical protein
MPLIENQKRKNVKEYFLRICILLVLFVMALIAPWWVSMFFAFILIVFFTMYEAVLVGLILDSLFASVNLRLNVTEYMYTSLLLLTITLSWFLSNQVRNLRK